jgi:hypothetical protein
MSWLLGGSFVKEIEKEERQCEGSVVSAAGMCQHADTTGHGPLTGQNICLLKIM